jgi:Dolichyl-phosphate-mannose-protein mannosyltransferase
VTPNATRVSLARQLGPPLCVALAATAWLVVSVREARPGVTLDEPFNVQEGVRLARGIPGWIGGRYSLRDVFGDASEFPRGRRAPLGYHLPDHPPLGRVWLGAWHEATRTLPASGSPTEQGRLSFAAARVGSAVAFGLTVLLVGIAAARWYGAFAGFAASLALATMPRLFGHAHLAALETITNLTFTIALFAVAAFWKENPPRLRVAAWTGALLGLALLTKIQAVFLPLPVAVWALARYRQRAVPPLLVWGGVGLAVFFAGWPWLWLDPLHHPLEYFRQTTERASLHTFYFGTRYLDRDVPWHYPLVMFLTTVPIGWQIAGFLGAAQRGENPSANWRAALLAGTMLLPLVAFSIPGVTVYDGSRLFLIVFPTWAVFVGRGTAAMSEWLRRKTPRFAVPVTAVLLATSIVPLWQFRPCQLSYYNALTGGLWGAEKLGLEVSYWGDGLTPAFLDEAANAVPPGATIDVVPVMHQLQLDALRQQSAALRERNITLRGYDPQKHGPAKYVLFYRRRADLPPELEPLPDDARVLAEIRRQGVLLAGVIDTP